MKTLLAFLSAAFLFGQAKLPQYTKETLPNGVVIAMSPRSGVPLVHFRVMIKGGVESDPPHMAGLANLTESLLRRGTAKRSAAQFAEELDFRQLPPDGNLRRNKSPGCEALRIHRQHVACRRWRLRRNQLSGRRAPDGALALSVSA